MSIIKQPTGENFVNGMNEWMNEWTNEWIAPTRFTCANYLKPIKRAYSA